MASPNLFGTDLFQAYEQFSGPSAYGGTMHSGDTLYTTDTPPPTMPSSHPSVQQASMPSTDVVSTAIPSAETMSMTNPASNTNPASITNPTSITNRSTSLYDSGTIYNEMTMNQQLAALKNELQRQKDINKLGNRDFQESIVDRFVSKKKEVFKLVTMSMTILLAISIHFVLNDLIRNYIVNNNLTDNQELTTKVAYPLTILLVIWMFKVFNR